MNEIDISANNCFVCGPDNPSGLRINFIIDDKDTIWIDEECYNDWCICIDECKAGLCCEFLR